MGLLQWCYSTIAPAAFESLTSTNVDQPQTSSIQHVFVLKLHTTEKKKTSLALLSTTRFVKRARSQSRQCLLGGKSDYIISYISQVRRERKKTLLSRNRTGCQELQEEGISLVTRLRLGIINRKRTTYSLALGWPGGRLPGA